MSTWWIRWIDGRLLWCRDNPMLNSAKQVGKDPSANSFLGFALGRLVGQSLLQSSQASKENLKELLWMMETSCPARLVSYMSGSRGAEHLSHSLGHRRAVEDSGLRSDICFSYDASRALNQDHHVSFVLFLAWLCNLCIVLAELQRFNRVLSSNIVLRQWPKFAPLNTVPLRKLHLPEHYSRHVFDWQTQNLRDRGRRWARTSSISLQDRSDEPSLSTPRFGALVPCMDRRQSDRGASLEQSCCGQAKTQVACHLHAHGEDRRVLASKFNGLSISSAHLVWQQLGSQS